MTSDAAALVIPAMSATTTHVDTTAIAPQATIANDNSAQTTPPTITAADGGSPVIG